MTFTSWKKKFGKLIEYGERSNSITADEFGILESTGVFSEIFYEEF